MADFECQFQALLHAPSNIFGSQRRGKPEYPAKPANFSRLFSKTHHESAGTTESRISEAPPFSLRLPNFLKSSNFLAAEPLCKNINP